MVSKCNLIIFQIILSSITLFHHKDCECFTIAVFDPWIGNALWVHTTWHFCSCSIYSCKYNCSVWLQFTITITTSCISLTFPFSITIYSTPITIYPRPHCATLRQFVAAVFSGLPPLWCLQGFFLFARSCLSHAIAICPPTHTIFYMYKYK